MKSLLLVIVLSLTGCKGMIHVDNVAGTFADVAERHDAYVNADTKLTPVERDIAKRDTALLRDVISGAQK